jgi:hypothetical protein
MKYILSVLVAMMFFAFAQTSYAQSCKRNAGVQVQEYVYDFAVDGGGTGEKFLSSKAGYKPIPNGAVVKGVAARVVTAVVGTSSTLAWGNDDAATGYSGSAIAEASLTINSVHNGWDNGASLLWDDSNDHAIYNPVINTDDGEFSVTIGTAALTAGKVIFMVEYYCPSL